MFALCSNIGPDLYPDTGSSRSKFQHNSHVVFCDNVQMSCALSKFDGLH